MALTVGTDTYIDETDADTYMSTERLYSDVWDAATSANKEVALRMATNWLDHEVDWIGTKATEAQALEWPRVGAYDRNGFLIDPSTIPTEVANATAELALFLLTSDRTGERSGMGLKSLQVDVIALSFDKYDTKPLVPMLVRRMIAHLGYVHNENTIKTRNLVRT